MNGLVDSENGLTGTRMHLLKDALAKGWEIKVEQHNREGDLLSERLQVALGEAYEIEFSPITYDNFTKS